MGTASEVTMTSCALRPGRALSIAREPVRQRTWASAEMLCRLGR